MQNFAPSRLLDVLPNRLQGWKLTYLGRFRLSPLPKSRLFRVSSKLCLFKKPLNIQELCVVSSHVLRLLAIEGCTKPYGEDGAKDGFNYQRIQCSKLIETPTVTHYSYCTVQCAPGYFAYQVRSWDRTCFVSDWGEGKGRGSKLRGVSFRFVLFRFWTHYVIVSQDQS